MSAFAYLLLGLFCGGGFEQPTKLDPFMAFNQNTTPDAIAGMRLFTREWTHEPNSTIDGMSSDGLGPLYNANSCSACHPQGGSADNQHNVQLITFLETAKTRPSDWLEVASAEGQLLENLAAKTFMLPRQSVDPNYESWRNEYLGLASDEVNPKRKARIEQAKLNRYENRDPLHRLRTVSRTDIVLSERNTPALFGAGLVNSISLDTLESIAKQQAARDDLISGRVAMVFPTEPGRFGWRGQISTLKQFVVGACANELGLQSAKARQMRDPLTSVAASTHIDIDELSVTHMVSFIEALPSPKPMETQDLELKAQLAIGRQLMHQVHCARCHVPDIEKAIGIYSDLLLHDMGSALTDPVPARPEMLSAGFATSNSSYTGSVTVEMFKMAETNIRQEWRTPPLWGVADSAPYLHDGRAKTLIEAIRMHDGEASKSRDMFLSLTPYQQQSLLAFLARLKMTFAERG